MAKNSREEEVKGMSRGCTRRELLAMGAGLLVSQVSGGASTDNTQKEELARRRRWYDKKRPNIIVYLSDALRADHLGCYKEGVELSPKIDAFADKSIVFERCYAQSSWTKPSIASLFTGVLPSVHQAVITCWNSTIEIDHPIQVLRDEFVTLAECLQKVGYQTVAFLANPQVDPNCGMTRGFDFARKAWGEPPERQMAAVIDWLHAEADPPFFLYIHEIDPHGPYQPSNETFEPLFGVSLEEARRALSEGDQHVLDNWHMFYKLHGKGTGFDKASPTELSEAGLKHFHQLYQAEVAYMNRQFNRLVGYLTRRKQIEKCVLVFTADHGEGFNEHGNFFHGTTLYDEELHVPLIIRAPRLDGQVRVPWTVSLMDLFPTLVTVAGGNVPSYVQAGTLLTRRRHLAVDHDRPVFAELDEGRRKTGTWPTAMLLGSRKLMSYNRTEQLALYDLKADPRETRDLLAQRDVPSSSEQGFIKGFHTEREEHRQLAQSFGEAQWTEGDEELQQALAALGYV